jgi:hypothetical protein
MVRIPIRDQRPWDAPEGMLNTVYDDRLYPPFHGARPRVRAGRQRGRQAARAVYSRIRRDTCQHCR